jgi:hypothetical protein
MHLEVASTDQRFNLVSNRLLHTEIHEGPLAFFFKTVLSTCLCEAVMLWNSVHLETKQGNVWN